MLHISPLPRGTGERFGIHTLSVWSNGPGFIKLSSNSASASAFLIPNYDQEHLGAHLYLPSMTFLGITMVCSIL